MTLHCSDVVACFCLFVCFCHLEYFVCINSTEKTQGRKKNLLSILVNAKEVLLLNQKELLLLCDCDYLPLSPYVFWSAAINSLDTTKREQRGVCQSSRPNLNYSNLALCIKISSQQWRLVIVWIFLKDNGPPCNWLHSVNSCCQLPLLAVGNAVLILELNSSTKSH